MSGLSKIIADLTRISLLCGALAPAAVAGEGRNVSFTFEMGSDGVLFGRVAGEDLPLQSTRGIPAMSEHALARALASSELAENEDGETTAIVAELANYPQGMAPGQAGEVLWNVVIPGVGSIIGSGMEALPASLAAAYGAAEHGETWSAGPVTAQFSVGPMPKGQGYIVGGTGAFEGAKGTFARFVTLREVGADGIEGTTELRFAIEE